MDSNQNPPVDPAALALRCPDCKYFGDADPYNPAHGLYACRNCSQIIEVKPPVDPAALAAAETKVLPRPRYHFHVCGLTGEVEAGEQKDCSHKCRPAPHSRPEDVILANINMDPNVSDEFKAAMGAAVRGALKLYGRHGAYGGSACERSKHSEWPCTCGFEKALAILDNQALLGEMGVEK